MDRKVVPMIFWLFVSLLLHPAPGLSSTITWTGVVDDYWNHAGNWDSATVPGRDDKAIIENGDTVLIASGSPLIHQLELSSTSGLNISAALWFQSPLSENYILNNGTIWVGNSGNNGNISCWGDTVLLTGTGTLILGGYPAIRLTGTGGSFINNADHTIRGGGQIQALSANQGQVIADNGTLEIKSQLFPVDNTGGTMSASGSGNVLYINYGAVTNGAINPQDGKVALFAGLVGNVTFGPGSVEVRGNVGEGSTLQNTVTLSSGTTLTTIGWTGLYGDTGNPATLVNNGTIFISPTDPDRITYISGDLTFQGPGTLTMGGPGNVIDGTGYNLINSAPHLIQGSGSITSIINDGAIIAKDGTLTVSGVTGAGMVDVANDATLSVTPLNLQTGYLTMAPRATLVTNITSGLALIDLKHNFIFFQIDPARWNWGTSGLNMSGGTGRAAPQTLEVGCRDNGANASGYTSNFVLPNLRVTGANTYVSLVDTIDNGHRAGGREALYVTTLFVEPGATLNLNGLKLYAKRGGTTIFRVKAGEGSSYGGGKIIDSGGFLPAVDLMLLD